MANSKGLLQQEIRQTKPFRSAEHEAILNLFRTSDHLRHSLSKLVAAEGLTLQHYNVLRILRGAGDQGLPTLEIAERLVERSPGITRLVDRLEAGGLLRRERVSTDRRCVYCFVTPPGMEALARLDEPIDEWTRRQIGRLGTREIEALIRMLEDLRSETSD